MKGRHYLFKKLSKLGVLLNPSLELYLFQVTWIMAIKLLETLDIHQTHENNYLSVVAPKNKCQHSIIKGKIASTRSKWETQPALTGFFLSYLHFDPAGQKHSKYNNLLEESCELYYGPKSIPAKLKRSGCWIFHRL